MRREEILLEKLERIFDDRNFRKEMGMTRQEMEKFKGSIGLRDLASELSDSSRAGERFSMKKAVAIAAEYFPAMVPKPEGGWLDYCYQYILHQLFPALGREEIPSFRRGRMCFLQMMRGLVEYELEQLPFDPTRNMIFLSDSEVEEKGYNQEYIRMHRLVRQKYVYEFMRIGTEITPFNTLGHISGVHYVAMYAARQLAESGVPVDLAIVSGAAAGHDIGKYGCRKSEERRIPYLHYYYTDRCYRQFDLNTIGHIAANHSTWDLELENLSVESLLLIYADFRVKSYRDETGREIIRFYTLKEAYDVILNKLDNVDEAKAHRYHKVYSKLADFEEYMKEQGVSVVLPEDWAQSPKDPVKPARREAVLMEGEECLQQVKYQAIDHNIRLLSRFHDDVQFGNLIEAARSEHHWKNLRTYISILGEYSTYMTETQKMMTMRFLYEMLAHKEGDIRSQAAVILGKIVGTYNNEYNKELPEGETLPDNAVTNLQLFSLYLNKIFRPDHKLTEQNKKWIQNCLDSFTSAVVENCKLSCQHNYIDILAEYFERTDYSEGDSIILLKVVTQLKPEQCPPGVLQVIRGFVDKALRSRSQSLRVAAVLAGGSLFEDYRGENQTRLLMEIQGISGEPETFARQLSAMFLDDLKAGTPWTVKMANIRLMLHHLSEGSDRMERLHIATHLANLVKVSERVTVRRTAGKAILSMIDYLSPEQRNELAVELYNGLEIGDYQFSKYIPDYLGIIMLHLPPKELDEFIDTMESNLGNGNDKLSDAIINTLGVVLENYPSYFNWNEDADETHDERLNRILFTLIKGVAYYDPLISREAFWVMGQHFFGSKILTLNQKRALYEHCFKKILSLILERKEENLDFYNNAAVLNHIYRFISEYQTEIGPFKYQVNQKVAFYPGTFDPFSLGHKAVARTIRNMGFDVYLALDEFSWSKNTQPRLQRRRIMNMSVADEESIFPFPDDFSVNIANDDDVRKLKEAFQDKELYIAVGSDVVRNASCYRNPPSENSIHGINHIIFERESDERNEQHATEERYPITGEVIRLSLKKYYEDISSTRIRDNIDMNRDISNLIDPVAQNYIFDRNLYMREPAYKHVLQARDLEISPYGEKNMEELAPILPDLLHSGYDKHTIEDYIRREGTRALLIESCTRKRKMVGAAAAHRMETHDLLEEFGDPAIASHIREAAAGGIAVIGLFHSVKTRSISNVSQILLTEILTELIARDFAYVVYHPVDEAGLNPKIIELLRRQGFINIAEGRGQQPVYAVDMKSPMIIFRDVDTVIKNPFNKNAAILHAIDEAHNDLLHVMTEFDPGQLVLSFNTSAVHHKIIDRVATINGVSTVQDKNKVRGPYMTVPFGKSLSDVAVPNTVTKALHTEKYFERDLSGFTISESRHYSPLEFQARTIRSFNRPVILIDDLLHKGNRMNIIDPILRRNKVNVKEIVVGVMTGNARDDMMVRGREVQSAYFLPTLKTWLNERDCYLFIGGDSLKGDALMERNRNTSVNLILPYTMPDFIGHGNMEQNYRYSMTCLVNARNIWTAIEEEYQKTYERRLTLKRIGEVITYPRIPDLGEGITLDESLAPTAFIDNAIERLIRMKLGKE